MIGGWRPLVGEYLADTDPPLAKRRFSHVLCSHLGVMWARIIRALACRASWLTWWMRLVSQHVGLPTSRAISSDETAATTTIINRFIACSSALCCMDEADLFLTPVGVSVRTNWENYWSKIDMNACYGAPWKWLQVVNIWPWPWPLTLRATLMAVRRLFSIRTQINWTICSIQVKTGNAAMSWRDQKVHTTLTIVQCVNNDNRSEENTVTV